MKKNQNKQVSAIILAAGKGARMNNSKKVNKTMMLLGDKPMVAFVVETLKKLNLGQIILVVGYAKESIITYFQDKVDYAVQRRCLGTANAVKVGLKQLSKKNDYVLVTNGDDSAFYSKVIFAKLIKACLQPGVVFSLLTLRKRKPEGLGRIIRDSSGQLIGIIEEKNATRKQKEIKEINTGTYCFRRKFLEKYLPLVRKNKLTGEYYLTDTVSLAIRNKLQVATLKLKDETCWHGVNTKDQLKKAQRKMQQKINKDK